ncbi:MAG: intein-containing RctB family protein [Candidatus Bathyarchaeia archaeon]
MGEEGYSGETSYGVPLQRINEYMWRIPESFKPGMSVPGLVLADEKLLEKMRSDRTLIQCANVATMPGIYKYSITLPDGHEGYGFPIGGVGAFDAETGVVSPGGVGYDINCLAPNSVVLTEYGYWLRIEEISKKICNQSLKVYDVKEGHNDSSNIAFVAERSVEPGEFAIQIVTEGGRVIEGSRDHPILTPEGYKNLEEIKEGDHVIVYPFEGVEYSVDDHVLLDDGDFRECDHQILTYLKKKGLIPLRLSDPKVGLLARLFGYALGDGSLHLARGKRLVLSFHGEAEELKEIIKDLKKLGVKPSKIYMRKRRVRIKTAWNSLYESHCTDSMVKVTSRAFSILMHKLGMPIGKKTKQAYRIPEWIKNAQSWIKRNFLAGLFGADGSIVCFNGYTPLPISFTQSKKKELEDNLTLFLEEVSKILREFNVKSIIYKVKSLEGRITYRLSIVDEDSIRNFLGYISYEYSPKKRAQASIAYEYLKRKHAVKKMREEAVEKAMGVYASTESISKAYEAVAGKHINRRLVERNIYGTSSGVRIAQDFPTFEEFASKFYHKGGFVSDKVVRVEYIKPSYTRFYDIGVYHDAHNFIANGIVVHNCGVRLVKTNLTVKDVKPVLKQLTVSLFRNVPSGLGSRRKDLRVTSRDLDELMVEGAGWVVKHGLGWDEDLEYCEERGSIEGADPSKVSNTARSRGEPQIGTLGSGNHFLEIDVVDRIEDPKVAKVFGIEQEGQIMVLIHTGSRGFGHQICSDYLRVMERAMHKYGIRVPDRELACVPASSREGEDYVKAMKCGINYAFANRQAIMHWVRESFSSVFKRSPEDLDMHLIYDVAHNIAKLEEHLVDSKGTKRKVYVHRKGATRAFPAGRPEIPAKYRNVGQPVLLPGSMADSSWVLVGTPKSMELTFGSTAHGAGRLLSRAKAKERWRGEAIKREMERQGIVVEAASLSVLSEEASGAYKPCDLVAEVSHRVGIATKVARLVPIAVVKG